MSAPTREQLDACCKQIRDWLAEGRVFNGPCSGCKKPPETVWMDNERGKVRRPDGTFLCERCRCDSKRGRMLIQVETSDTAQRILAAIAEGFNILAREGYSQAPRLADYDGLVVRRSELSRAMVVELVAERP